MFGDPTADWGDRGSNVPRRRVRLEQVFSDKAEKTMKQGAHVMYRFMLGCILSQWSLDLILFTMDIDWWDSYVFSMRNIIARFRELSIPSPVGTVLSEQHLSW